MTRARIKELSDHTSEIVHKVREDHETIELTSRSEVFTRIAPVRPEKIDPEALERSWAERDRLDAEIGERWPMGVTAAQAIAEDQR